MGVERRLQQDASGLAFGEKRQSLPPDLAGDVAGLIGKGVEAGKRAGLAVLFAGHDPVWHW